MPAGPAATWRIPGRGARRGGGHHPVAREGARGAGGTRAARDVRGRLPAARPPARGQRPRGRGPRGRRRRAPPGPGRPARARCPAHPRPGPADRAQQPQPGPGGRGGRRAGGGLLLRRAGVGHADQAGPPGDRPGPGRPRGAGQPARPWFAIGGIDLGRLDAVLAAGATRVVVVRAITEADDPGRPPARSRAACGPRPGEPPAPTGLAGRRIVVELAGASRRGITLPGSPTWIPPRTSPGCGRCGGASRNRVPTRRP